jgi:hypothetical protein
MIGIEIGIFIIGFLTNRAFRKYLFMTMACLFLFCVVGELYFRLFYFGVEGLSFRECTPAGLYHPISPKKVSRETLVGMKPNTTMKIKGKSFTTNSEGFRSKNYPVDKDSEVYRIVISGASATQGLGVGDDEVYPAVLEKLLNNAGLEKEVQVLNLSAPAIDIGNMLYIMESVGMKYSPDLILVIANKTRIPAEPLKLSPPKKLSAYTGTKMELITDPKYKILSNLFFFLRLIYQEREGKLETQKILYLKRDSSFVHQKLVNFENHNMKSPAKINYSYPGRVASLTESLKILKNLSRDGRAYLCLLKSSNAIKDTNHDIGYRTFVKQHAQQHGVGVIDTFDIDMSSLTSRQYIIYPGDQHPNAYIHRLFAEKLYSELLDDIKTHIRNETLIALQ